MYKFIFSFKHSIGACFNLITSVNKDGIVEYEYSYCPRYLLDLYLSPEHVKDTLNKDLSKQFIEYIELAKIDEMDEDYIRLEQVLDNAPDCNLALIKDIDSFYVSVEADSYPETFKYIVKALELINNNFTYWYKYQEKELS